MCPGSETANKRELLDEKFITSCGNMRMEKKIKS
jgi:hypothetical protein